jgi:hypothetical protein
VRTIDEKEINVPLPRREIKASAIPLQRFDLGLQGMAFKHEAFRLVVGHPGGDV